jgi:hypothetical protein
MYTKFWSDCLKGTDDSGYLDMDTKITWIYLSEKQTVDWIQLAHRRTVGRVRSGCGR